MSRQAARHAWALWDVYEWRGEGMRGRFLGTVTGDHQPRAMLAAAKRWPEAFNRRTLVCRRAGSGAPFSLAQESPDAR